MSASAGEDWDSFINRLISLENMNTALLEAGDEMEKRLCQIIFNADCTDNELVDVVNTWVKAKEGAE